MVLESMAATKRLQRTGAAASLGAASGDNMADVEMLARRVVAPQHDAGNAAAGPPPGATRFRMLKRGAKGKLEARALDVPDTTRLASMMHRNEQAQADERNLLKRRTLQAARNIVDD